MERTCVRNFIQKQIRGNLEQDFSLDKIQKIPIIKHGGNISIKSVQIENQKFSFTNTCAFDSILQLFISAYFDKNYIKDLIHKENSNMFFKLTLNVVTHGIKYLLIDFVH